MRRPALLAAVALTGVLAAPAAAHKGNPDFESVVNRVSGVEGLRVQVVNGDDSLQLVNEGDREVVVVGYEDEPYVRMRPGGVVEVNQRSTATYLNEERYGGADVPKSADPKAPPEWKVVARNGRYAFHDHRIHWMNENDPPKITDESQRQKVFDWRVPLRAGAAAASIEGTLWWRGGGDGVPLPAVIAGAVLILGSLVLLVVVRRRRRSAEPREEAW